MKPLEGFPRVKGKNDKVYYRGKCKACRKQYEKRWRAENIEHVEGWRKSHYKENREQIKARVAEWQKENRSRKLAYQREWYLRNQEERIELQRRWYANNKQEVKAYREANKDKISKRMIKWRSRNAGIIVRYQEEWRRENADHIRAYSRRYRTEKPESKRLSQARRRAAMRQSEGSFTWDDVENLLIFQDCKCVYCEAELGDGNFQIDHITPLSRGGPNVAENIQLLCRSCNLKKHAKTHDEFLEFLHRSQ